MHLPQPFVRPQSEPPALVRVVTREEVHWNRPVFKAPPLEIVPPLQDVLSFVQGRMNDRRMLREI